MKNLVSFSLLILLVASCSDHDAEPRYDSRDKFVGYYDVEEFSEVYRDITYYEMRITRSRYEREIYLDNFYDAGIRVYAIVRFNDITIPLQEVHGFEVEGSGSLYHDELNLRYRVKDLYDHSISDYCETVAWR